MMRCSRFGVGLVLAGVSAAGGQPLAPPVQDIGLLPGDASVGPAVNSQQDHSVAKGGDQYLAVWSDSRGRSSGSQTIQSDGDIFGIRLDASGNPIDAAPFLIAGGTGLQQRPRVAWNGENWLVLYESQDPTAGYYDTFIRTVRVSPQGQPLDQPPIQFPLDQFSPNTIGLNVAGQNGQWLVTRCVYHGDGYGTYLAGQRIAGDGHLVDVAPVMLNDWVYGQLSVIANNGEYLVVGPDWNNSSVLKGRRINPNLQPLVASFNLPPVCQSITGNGSGEYYVAWISNFTDLVGSRMTSAGVLLSPAGTLLVPTFSGEMSSMHDGTNWWLSWTVNTARTLRIGPTGAVLDPGGVLLPIVVTGNITTLYGSRLVPRSGGGAIYSWHDYRAALGSDGNVFALPISAANVAATERCVSTGTPSQRSASLCAGPGGTAAVALVSELANDDRVLVHLLISSGAPMNAVPIEVCRAPTIGRAGIAWNGSLFMVAWDQGASGLTPVGIKARRMNPNGTFVDAQPIDVMPGFNADVGALGEDFLVAGARPESNPQFIDLWANRIDGPTGALLDGASGVILAGGYVSGMPRVRSDGARWLVAAHSMWSHDASQGDVILAKVPPIGPPTPAFNPTPISGGTGDLDVAFSGTNYLLVWRSNSLSNANNYVAGRIMNTDGTYGPAFTIAEAAGRQLRPTVAWDGTSYLVAWDDQRNQDSFFDARTDVYAVRVSQAGALLDPAAFAVAAGANAECSPAILPTRPGACLVATTRFITAPPLDSYRIGLTALGAPACPVDVDGNGQVQPADVSAFINRWLASLTQGTLGGDFDRNGAVQPADVAAFVSAWYFAVTVGC